jgi:cysteine desulfurase
MSRAYFDYNATTPPAPAVIEAMARALSEDFGNASSVHYFGQRAKALLDEARSGVAELIGAEPAEVVFTSGGTESDNLALRGTAEAVESGGSAGGRRHIITSSIEHEAVLNTVKALAKRGWTVTLLPVDATGILSPAALASAITPATAIVSVMHANNEIGTVQPVADLAAIAHEHGALFHTDAVQSAGKIPVDVRTLGVDLLTISAHKFYGPKGAGALWIRRGTRVVSTMTGGKHERNRRGGTENVPGIAGMGVAARLAQGKLAASAAEIGALRDRLVSPRAQHDEHQLRRGRGGVAADRARPRGVRGLDGIGLFLGHPRAVARAARDGASLAPHAELNPFQPRRRQYAGAGGQLDREASHRRGEASLTGQEVDLVIS